MSLDKYIEKRDFSKTDEPKAGKGAGDGKLVFVVQKHDASHLHYDFRLEMDGVLKSWAVPKGPSMNPKDKRLAMMVEDHPFDYKNFEGIIPKGEYGGGTVIIWDEGTYEPLEELKGKKAQEKHLLHQLHTGSLKFRLNGKKLQGEFALVKTRGMGENGWLLIKHKDKYASDDDITLQDRSVRSGKTIESMASDSDKVWKNGKEQLIKQPRKEQRKKKKGAALLTESLEEPHDSTEGKNAADVFKKTEASPMPEGIKPMLATLVDDPFDDSEWVYEVKWDGYRTLAYIQSGDVELLSRNNKSFNEKFYPLHHILSQWKLNAVMDGEVVVLDNKGISNFNNLQNWRSEADGDLVYYVFDLLWYEGHNLMPLPLTERQAALKEILPVDDDRIRLSRVFSARGTEFFKAAEKIGLEGIIAKKGDTPYIPNFRSREWLKIKVHKRQEVVIGGFTKNEDTSRLFSSLLLGVYEGDGKLHYVGKVGTGFTGKMQKVMMAQFKPLITDKSPFEVTPDYNKPSRFRPHPPHANATWLEPRLVCEVAFSEVTSDGVFRHPSFQGMRIDKNAEEVVREAPENTDAVIRQEAVWDPRPEQEVVKPPESKGRKTLLNPRDETQVRTICGHDLKFTHLSKLYWPEDHISKRDLFNYYYQIAEYILPYLKDRPMSLNRFPGGIHGKSFYQKDVKGKSPDWVKTFPHTTGEGEMKEYLVGNDEATLLWMASLGCIEMNPWFSRVQNPDYPDYCVIDLDPDKNTFDQVIEAALVVKKILDAIDVPAYCKTSGSTGMHIYIPLGAAYTYDQSQMFARIIVNIVHREIPEFTTLERMISNRKGKMYLDFLQNRPGATIACPYSLRPKPGATVSTPLHWEEVKPGLKMRDFHMFNVPERLKREGDLFHDVLKKGINLEETIKKAQRIFP